MSVRFQTLKLGEIEMANGNFAIRCPICHECSEYKDIPEEIAVSSVDEFTSIMQQFQRGERNKKLLRCKSPRLFCPAPFEAIVYKSGSQEFEELKIPNSWSLTRRFRLPKNKDEPSVRWDSEMEGKYCCILFHTQSVQRLRYIELESLMNRELVSRLISGICVEIDTPLTFFAGNVFEPEDRSVEPKVYWVPIEGYSQDEKKLVPPRYNLFCKTCRDISMRKLVVEFNKEKENKYNIKNCHLSFVKNEKCGGKEAVCMREQIEWDHCPAFVQEREDKCPCYNSDLALITLVEKFWREKKIPEYGIQDKCHAGFHEVAFPIEVHGHLVGVAITGQMFFKPDEIKQARDFINSRPGTFSKREWPTQIGEEDTLNNARQRLIGTELDKTEEKQKTVFLIDEEKLEQKIKCLLPNLDRFKKSAESHYRDFRVRSEFAFRQELLGFIENQRTQEDFFKNEIPYVLKRMQEFWAFNGVYLLNYSFDTMKVSTIAMSILGRAEAFGFTGKNGLNLKIGWQEFHPYPYLHFRGSEPHSVSSTFNQAIPLIEQIVDRNNKGSDLKIKNQDCEFLVVVPTYRGVYTFLFAVRDQYEVSSLESLNPGNISNLCQDAIFETCSEIVGEFHNVREFAERDKQIRIKYLEKLLKNISDEVDNTAVALELETDSQKIREGSFEIIEITKNRIKREIENLKSTKST